MAYNSLTKTILEKKILLEPVAVKKVGTVALL